MGKTVWIMNHYASHMLFDKGGRHYCFAKYLKRAGYDPVVFCANIQNTRTEQRYFDTDALWTEKLAEEIGVPFVYVRARTYRGNGKQRVLNMIDFYRNVKKAAKEYAALRGGPDVILASSVHPLTLAAGLQLARRFRVKCICEVRDLWPESIVAYGLAGAHHPAVLALRALEKRIYRKADALIFTAEGMYDYVSERGWEKAVPREKVYYINNGVDLEVFAHNRESFRIRDGELENKSLKKLVYTGSIRRVNGLGLLLDAAKLIEDETVRFLIWGDGDELEGLRQRVERENIRNVVFKGRVDKAFVPYITSQADLNLAHNTPSPLFRYGISFNKLFDYLAAARPILSDFPCAYNPAVQCGAGFEVAEPDAQSIARAITQIFDMPPSELAACACRAGEAAEREYDYKVLTRKLIAVIDALGGNDGSC